MTDLTTRTYGEISAEFPPIPSRPRQLITTVLYPPFLRRLDNQLLLNTPWLWATKLHRVAWLSLFPLLLALVLGTFVPFYKPYLLQRSITSSVILIVMLQIGLLVYWLYGSDFRHVEQERGKLRDHSGWREYASYALVLLLIGSSIVVYLAVATSAIQRLDRRQFALDYLVLRLNDGINSSYNRYGPPRTYSFNDNYLKDLAPAFFSATEFNDYLEQTVKNYPSFYKQQYEFFSESLTPADLTPLMSELEDGDVYSISALVGYYSGLSVEQVEASKLVRLDEVGGSFDNKWKQIYPGISDRAERNAWLLFRLGFDDSLHLLRNFAYGLIMFALHGALLRFIYRHVKLRGFLVILGSCGLFIFTLVLVNFMIQLLDSYSYRSGYYSQEPLFGLEHIVEHFLTLCSVLMIAWALNAHRRAKRISAETIFSWRSAIQLYIVPLLFIAIPYMLIFIIELQSYVHLERSNGFFSEHFLNNPQFFNNKATWSLYPLGYYILFWAQFAYLPLLPFLKRQHTRLLALPKR